jgi:hypothetical protein
MMTAIFLFSSGFKKIRGIELHVVDDETNEPLKGICILYQVIKVKHNLVDGVEIVIITEKTETDENGIAIVKPHQVFLGLFEFILSESIYVNIDINNLDDPEKINYHLKYYFLSSGESPDEKINIPNIGYYPLVIYNRPPNRGDGYMKRQESDSTSSLMGQRFVIYQALSNMREKLSAIITVALKRRT